MNIPILGISVLWLFLYVYIIIASINYGAEYYAIRWNRDARMFQSVSSYVSSVWKVTNIVLIFFLVGFIGFFPNAAFYYGSSLLLPGSIVLLLVAFRILFQAFNYSFEKRSKYILLYGIAGILIPAVLSIPLIISEGGFIIKQGSIIVFLAEKLLTSLYSWSVILFVIVSVLYISTSFLTYYAYQVKDEESLAASRKMALFWAVFVFILNVIVFISMRMQNIQHFQNMMHIGNIWLFVLAFVSFLGATHYIFHRKRFGLAFMFVLLQYLFAFFGYGLGHIPYIIYPYITVYSGFSNEVRSPSLVILYSTGLCLLTISAVLLFRRVLIDTKYKGRQ